MTSPSGRGDGPSGCAVPSPADEASRVNQPPRFRPPFGRLPSHGVVHACMASDRLDEAEELAVVHALLDGGPEP